MKYNIPKIVRLMFKNTVHSNN